MSRIEDNGNTFILLNVHLHGLSLPQANDIADCLRNHAHMASLDPTGYFVSVLGDFNFRYDDKPILPIPDSKAIFKEPMLPKISKMIRGALDLFTRVEHDHFSHYNASLGHLNDIDFIFISAPGWSQLPLNLEVEVGPPEVYFNKGLSDHGHVKCSFKRPGGKNPDQPIAPWIAKSPLFKENLELLVGACRLNQLLPEHALAHYKTLIREAARLTRNTLNEQYRNHPSLIYIAS